jgi:membrane protease YdiL (CAAX protease family)
MSLDPEQDRRFAEARKPDASIPRPDGQASPEDLFNAVNSYFPYEFPERELSPEERPALLELPAKPIVEPEWLPPQPRIPNLGHVLLLALLGVVGLLGSGLLVRSGLHFHLFGIASVQKATTDVHYTVGSMAVLYLIAFGSSLIVFPMVWHQGLFAGLHWNALAALRRVRTLFGAACMCFVLAIVDEVVLPGPTNAPIDKLFDTRTAAWLLFAFGVTFAPFFEEIIFRGFLLPAFCTAFDWSVEQAVQTAPLPLDAAGNPQWSLGAMIFASIATSVPFALMHAEQTAWSLGPFLLLVCVSLVLCWARLSTRLLQPAALHADAPGHPRLRASRQDVRPPATKI